MSVEKLVEEAVKVHADTIALTDINNSTAIPELVKECRKKGLKPVAGIEFRSDHRFLYIVIARNNVGFRELNDFLTGYNMSGEPLPFPAPRFLQCYTVYSMAQLPKRKLFENERIGLKYNEAGKLISLPSAISRESVIALCPVTLASKDEYLTHRSLRAIDNSILLSRLDSDRQCADNECFMPSAKITERFSRYPEAVINSINLLNDCSIDFDFNKPKNKQIYSASHSDDRLLLEKLAWDGMVYRYGKNNKEAARRIKHELEIIDRLRFSSYFLIKIGRAHV